MTRPEGERPPPGNIIYTYDASGEKLQKQTIDSAGGLTTTTLYLDGFQYQRRTPVASPGSGVDTLQFVCHEEGRARWAFLKHLAGDSLYAWEYDFAEKDHLANTRVLLTQEKDTAQYMATMEAAYRTTEKALFYNVDSTSYARASVSGYPVDVTVTNPNDSVSRVNGNGPKVGPTIILKVMAGDKIDLGVQYYYNSITNTNGPALAPQDLLNSLASGLTTLSGPAHGTFAMLDNPSSSPLLAALSSSIGNETGTGTSKPQAYLNWVLLDNQFNYVGGNNQSGALQVAAAGTQSNGTLQPRLAYTGLPITKSGYLYIYVSNATPGWDVFFDNLSVVHYSGPLIEENHYYPFGLTMAGISDKAIKTNYAENKYRFNKGSELQNKEFSDGSGLELYETPLRSLDPQLGRWWQIDSKPDESTSPYSSMGNNPILRNDPLGDTLDFPNASETFIEQFYDAYANLDSHGVGDEIAFLINSPQHITVFQQVGVGNSSYEDGVLWWNPTAALETTNGHILTAAAILDHEADHAVFEQVCDAIGKSGLDPTGIIAALPTILYKTQDKNYTNLEEKRVITGREQHTAKALGITKKGQVTRTDHKGHLFQTSGPTTTNNTNVDNMQKKLLEMQQQHSHMPRDSQEAHKMHNEAHKDDPPNRNEPPILY